MWIKGRLACAKGWLSTNYDLGPGFLCVMLLSNIVADSPRVAQSACGQECRRSRQAVTLDHMLRYMVRARRLAQGKGGEHLAASLRGKKALGEAQHALGVGTEPCKVWQCCLLLCCSGRWARISCCCLVLWKRVLLHCSGSFHEGFCSLGHNTKLVRRHDLQNTFYLCPA